MRDAEITLHVGPDEPRTTRHARLQGLVYDRLYSPAGLSAPEEQRSLTVATVAEELRELISDTHVEIFVCVLCLRRSRGLANGRWQDFTSRASDCDVDPMRVFYLQGDVVCLSSLLVLVLRATPITRGALTNVPEDCAAVARDTLNMHQQCITTVREYKGDPFIISKYINW